MDSGLQTLWQCVFELWINSVSSSHQPPLRKRNNREWSQVGVTHPVLKITRAEIISWYAFQWELSYHDDSQWYEHFSQHVCFFFFLYKSFSFHTLLVRSTSAYYTCSEYVAVWHDSIFTAAFWAQLPFLCSACVPERGARGAVIVQNGVN